MPKVFEELYDRTCVLCIHFVIDGGFKSPCWLLFSVLPNLQVQK